MTLMSVKIYFSQQKMTFFIYRQTEKQLIFNVPKCKENIANNLKAKLKRTNKTIIATRKKYLDNKKVYHEKFEKYFEFEYFYRLQPAIIKN